MDTEEAQTILYDVQGGVPVAKSRLKYKLEHLKFRTTVEAEWEEWQKEHPEAILDVPAEMSSEPLKEREFSGKKRAAMADKGTALPDGSYPIATAEDLSNAVQAIGRAKDPAKARAHIIKRARALGLTASLPDDWGVKEGQYELTAADWLALGAQPIEEMSGGHFFGRWKGGRAGAGGGPDANDDGKVDKRSQGQRLADAAKSGNIQFVSATGVTQGQRVRSTPHGIVSHPTETFSLTEADRLALHAAGLPVPVTEKSSGDHFYGAWKGGSAKSGGHPAEGGGGGGASDAKTIFGKKAEDFPTLAQARAKGPLDPVLRHDYASEATQARAMGLKKDAVTGRWYKPGGAAPKAPQMKGPSVLDKKPTRLGDGSKSAEWRHQAEKDWKKAQRDAKNIGNREAMAFGDTEVRALKLTGDGSDVELAEAIVMLDKAPTEAKVLQVGEDILVIPCWTGSFDSLGDAYVKPEPYVPDPSNDAQWNVSDAADMLRKLSSLKKREDDEGDQTAMLQTAIAALADYLKAEADEIGEADDVAEAIATITESVGEDSPLAAAIEEVGKRNSKADTETLKTIARLVKGLGIELDDEPDPEEVVESVEGATIDESADPTKVTFREAGAYGDYVTLAEASPLFDAESRTVWVTPIKPGWGNTRDNNFYPVETLKEATEAGKFNHLKMYRDHPRKSDEKDLPERSVKDWFATTREAEWDGTRQRPRVPIKVHDEADFNKWQDAPEQVAFSILGGGLARPGTKDGRSGRILESISKVRSVDWVTEAGAGGGIDFAESASSEERDDMPEIADITAEELAEGNPGLYEHLVGMGKALAGGDAAAAADAKAATKAAKADAGDGDGKPADAKESAPAWFVEAMKPVSDRLQNIETRETAAASAATLDGDKAKAKTVVTATLQESTLTAAAKAVIAGRFAEAAIGEGRSYADDAAVKTAVEGAITEAHTLLGTKPKESKVVGLGEGAASGDAASEATVRESVLKDIGARWGTEAIPVKGKLVYTADEVSGNVAPVMKEAGRGDPAPMTGASADVQEGIAARLGV